MKLKKSTASGIIIFIALVTVIGLSGMNYLVPTSVDRGVNNEPDEKETVMSKVSLKTKDNLTIAADLHSSSEFRSWLVLIHMMPVTKESWQSFASALTQLGYESIAIDLRGHGESDGGPDSYKNFSDAEHQKSILDLEAAVDYLITEKGATPDKISFVGASIGANLSLQYLSEHPEFKTAVLLSPGLDYRGIKTEPMVKRLKAGQRVFFISSRDDGSDASENQKLYDLAPVGVEKEIKIYETAGHGTTILEKESELGQLIVNFLK